MELSTPKIVEAMELALEAHKGQFDKANKPYVFHVIRVASKMKTEDGIIVALLHDVIEDAKDDYHKIIEEKFGTPIYSALLELTHDKNESYENYIKRIYESQSVARDVKISDLEDNMDANRTLEAMSYLMKNGIDAAIVKMLKKREKYLNAYQLLTSKHHG